MISTFAWISSHHHSSNSTLQCNSTAWTTVVSTTWLSQRLLLIQPNSNLFAKSLLSCPYNFSITSRYWNVHYNALDALQSLIELKYPLEKNSTSSDLVSVSAKVSYFQFIPQVIEHWTLFHSSIHLLEIQHRVSDNGLQCSFPGIHIFWKHQLLRLLYLASSVYLLQDDVLLLKLEKLLSLHSG